MKLYDLKPGSHFRLAESPKQPPDADHFPHPDREYKFGRIDGMYSWSLTEEGDRVYFAAWTEVEEV